MKSFVITIFGFLLFVCPCIQAQHVHIPEKMLQSVSERKAKSVIGFLASDALQGRRAGTNDAKVAAEYIKSILFNLGLKPLYGNSYFQDFEAYSRERTMRTLYSVVPDSITKYKQEGTFRKLSLRNVLACIEGSDKNAGYIVVGAHYDHLGMDKDLCGDQIYNGADDNASGVSAVVQIADAFVKSKIKPKRTIVFAFWDGEEENTLGSQYFVQNCSFDNQIKAYLNFDMIGRNHDESNPNYVVYFYTKSHPEFGEWLKQDIKQYHLHLTPNFRPWDYPVGGSDNTAFAKVHVPIIWYHTDGHIDYHRPGDQVEKINWSKLVDITKAACSNTWNLANNKDF